MPAFVPSRDLNRDFYVEAVRPLLEGRPHAAGLLGWGSDVLGYDTQRSTDHGWGLRVVVLTETEDGNAQLSEHLDNQLPAEFRGWPVRYGWDHTAVQHHVTVGTLGGWLKDHLGVDASAAMTTLDWLLTPQLKLLGVVTGAVYADERGVLGRVRAELAWYPEEVWRWLVACQWHRLAQEEAFVSRTAELGDEIGSATTAGRLVRDAMRLALLLDRRYAPYQKWLGTAFVQLTHPDMLPRHLEVALHSADAAARGAALAHAYECLAGRHNASGISDAVDGGIRDYYSRPAQVLLADRFADACIATVTDPMLRALPLIGAVDQAVDCTDILQFPDVYRRLAPLYNV